jgi:hypothetical protein
MTIPKGINELFWGREFEDVHDWVERLEMALEVVKGLGFKCLRSWLRLLQLSKT